jgi:transglutaminase-like putative cysteine protease
VKIRIQHRTTYFYAEKVPFGLHRLVLRPREGHGVHLEKCDLKVSPGYRMRWIRDPFDNHVALVELEEPATELIFDAEFVVTTRDDNPFNFIIENEAVEYPFSYDHDLQHELRPLAQLMYVRDERRVRDWVDQFWHPGKRIGTLQLLQLMNGNIYRTFKYRRREERGVQSPAETLETNSGSCRDFAILFIEACRYLGLGARFVSGYMYSSEITGRMSMHAWAEVFLPGAGWIGFDPSWGILASSQYVPVGVALHQENVTPISGTYIGTSRVFLKSQVDLFIEQMHPPAPAYANQIAE